MNLKITTSILFLCTCITSFCTTWTITNASTSFSPATLTITEGDTVVFSLANPHDGTEVSKTTWDANDATPLAGGFQTPTGGGMVLPEKLTVGTHYYVCSPHAAFGMKGEIIVQAVLSVVKNASVNVNLFPNPVNDLMSIKASKSLLGSTYYLYDITGRQILSGKLVSEITNVDVFQLPAGIYLLQVGSQNKQTFKVLKQ